MIKITTPLNPFLNIILISIVLSLVIYQTAYSQTDEESLMEKGIDAILDAQFEEAIEYFDKILEKDPPPSPWSLFLFLIILPACHQLHPCAPAWR